jgi:hypothetical protein
VKKPKKVAKPKKVTPSKKAATSKKETKLKKVTKSTKAAKSKKETRLKKATKPKKVTKPKKAAKPKQTVITRRQFPRVKSPVLYRSISTPGSKHKISDISLGGVRIFSNERIRKGKRLELELFLPQGQSLIVTAKVAWIRPLPKGSASPFDMGLEFISLPPNAMKELKTVLELPSSGE